MKLIRLIVRYIMDFTVANLTIAKQVLSPKMEIHPEVIELDTKVSKPAEILALSNMITFTPGTLTLELEAEKCLKVHVLDHGDEAAKAIRERLEEPLLEITRRKSS